MMKQVSKFFLGLMVMIMTLGMSVSMQSCGSMTAEGLAKSVNAQCPIDAGNGMTIKSVVAEGSTMVYNVECPDEIDVTAIPANYDKKAAIEKMKAQDKDFVEACGALGLNIKYVYKNSENSAEVLITADELK